jgi:hypothetical protein
LVSFGLGQIVDGETPVLKLAVPMPEFPVARLPEETSDGFRVREERAAVNIVGRYARAEHNVFEQASVPYGPRFEPSSEACEEAMKKRKSDAGAVAKGKRAKLSSRMVVPPKMCHTQF